MKSAEFAKTHRTDADWVGAMGDNEVVVLIAGQKGTYAGLPATVVRHYCNGMYEIRVQGGVVCVSGSEFRGAA